MRWNAQFRYSKSESTKRDENGFLTTAGSDRFVTGSLCQVERNAPAKHFIGTDGQEFTYTYEVFMQKEYGTTLAIGDTLELTLIDGTVIVKPIVGIDNTDNKTLAVWV